MPVLPDRWVPSVSDNPRPLSLPLPGGADLSTPFPSRARAHSLSALRACHVSATNRSPARSLSLAARWASPVSSVFNATTADPHLRLHRGDHSHHLPTRPSSLLNPVSTRSLSPASFRTRSPSLALYPCRSRSLEIRDRAPDRPARQKSRQATPSFVPWWGTHSHAWFVLILACFRYFWPRWSSATLARRPVDLASRRAAALVSGISITLPKPVQALERPKPPLRDRDSSPVLPDPPRAPSSVVIPSPILFSWLESHQQVCRTFLAHSSLHRRPQIPQRPRLPCLRRLPRYGEATPVIELQNLHAPHRNCSS
jgi:hypothetical protein